MDFSEDWKSFFPIGTSCASPILSGSSAKSLLGPLIFNPIPHSLTHIFSSSSLLPPLLPFPQLSVSRFLETSSSDSHVLPSTASSIAPLSGSPFQNDAAFRYNRLELLKYGGDTDSVLLFFPTGVNSEQIGFLRIFVEDSNLRVQFDGNGDVFRTPTGKSYQILRISVNPVDDDFVDSSSSCVGYLLASTLYSVHWFSVKRNSSLDRPSVVYLGCKVFKTCSVSHACWSPHIPEESVVLLENGELFLFDLQYYMQVYNSSNANFKGTRLRVPWNNDSDSSKDRVWLSCEFSWHHRILIVLSSDAVFLVDLRLDECIVTCVLKVEMLYMYTPAENERFLALSRAGPDNFYFTVASNNYLLLCDVRKAMKPVLRWAHGLDGPCFLNVINLSTMRSQSKEDTFESASESGFCIILGSFWNGEFNLFCYGSSSQFQKGSIISKLSKTNKNFCAWKLPSEFVLSGRDCHCGSCLLREELSKVALPEWIDWQMKKEIVLGFGIIDSELASLLSEPDEYGGFTLVRLLSSGELELQRYRASWVPDRKLEDCHEQVLCLDRHLLFSMGDEKYKFPKIFKFLNLNYLYAYLRGNLTEHLVKKLEDPCMDGCEKESFDTELHEFLCEKLNACGLGPFRSSPAITAYFKDVKLPSSLHEVALRRLWAELPLDLLQLAFSKYTDFHDVIFDQKRLALEFLVVPDLPQLPPFFLRKSSPRSNKWSDKVHCYDDIVGPVLPLPILVVLHEFHNGHSDMEGGKFSVEAELGLKYKEVMKVAGEISVSPYDSEFSDDHAVSLGDDGEETWVDSSKPKQFLLYRPVAPKRSDTDLIHGDSICRDKMYDTLIYRVPEEKSVSSEKTESVSEEIFDDLCPVELKFNAPTKKFDEPKALKAYKVLKKQISKWQEGFDLYKEFCTQSRFEKTVNK